MNNKIPDKKGFSLVELIVVIAIMAVLVAVLAPALLQYVEKSRAQKDDSAMGEVTNAIQLALADQNAYDEALKYVITGKDGTWAKSCYVDSDSPNEDHKVDTKSPNQYMYSDAERKADEVPYNLSGQMRGLTITFTPSAIKEGSKKKQFVLADGTINSDSNSALSEINAENDDDTSKGQIYNKLRAAIGDTVPVTSQTYRNSSYTVFIRMGTTGGNASDAQDAIKVYGQWGGTNLAETANTSGGNNSTGNTGDNGGNGDVPVVGNSIEVQYFDDEGNLSNSSTSATYALNSGNTNAAKVLLGCQSADIDKVNVQENIEEDTMTTIESTKYTVSNASEELSSTVAFKRSYLETLDEGNHKFDVVTTQGESAHGQLIIQSNSSDDWVASANTYMWGRLDDNGTLYLNAEQADETYIKIDNPIAYKYQTGQTFGTFVGVDSYRFSTNNTINKIVFENNIYIKGLTRLFAGLNTLTEIEGLEKLHYTGSLLDMFSACFNLTELSGFDNFVNCTNAAGMFKNCQKLVTLDISGLDMYNVTRTDWMFTYCRLLENVTWGNFDTENVTNAQAMFNECCKLLTVPKLNMPNVGRYIPVFYECNSLTSVDMTGVDISNATSLEGLFLDCSKLTSVNISNFDTSNIKSTKWMFSGCSSLREIDISNLDMSNVTNAMAMFSGCRSAETIKVNFNFPDNADLSSMLSNCQAITSFDMKNMNANNINMSLLFNGCKLLESVDFSGTSVSVSKTLGMFTGCSALRTVDMSGFDTSAVTSFAEMFKSCGALTSVNLSSFDTSNATSMANMFHNCSSLTSLDLTSFNTANVTTMKQMFQGMTSVQQITVGSEWVTAPTSTNMFYNCHVNQVTVA